MAVVYQFRDLFNQKQQQKEQEEFRMQYRKYILGSESWRQTEYFYTLYEGYPFIPPNEPRRDDMTWFVDPSERFGVWVVKAPHIPQEVSKLYGWSPFVRKSTLPIYEPFRVMDAEHRKSLAWIVDEQGYGQYGEVNERGEIWVPSPEQPNTDDQATSTI